MRCERRRALCVGQECPTPFDLRLNRIGNQDDARPRGCAVGGEELYADFGSGWPTNYVGRRADSQHPAGPRAFYVRTGGSFERVGLLLRDPLPEIGVGHALRHLEHGT